MAAEPEDVVERLTEVGEELESIASFTPGLRTSQELAQSLEEVRNISNGLSRVVDQLEKWFETNAENFYEREGVFASPATSVVEAQRAGLAAGAEQLRNVAAHVAPLSKRTRELGIREEERLADDEEPGERYEVVISDFELAAKGPAQRWASEDAAKWAAGVIADEQLSRTDEVTVWWVNEGGDREEVDRMRGRVDPDVDA